MRDGTFVKVNIGGKWWYCSNDGLTVSKTDACDFGICCDDVVVSACNNSIYAYEKMLAQGYFTLADGSRFGVAGEYSFGNAGFKKYTSVCVRVPHCVRCATEDIMSKVIGCNTLVVGAPATGKTTLIRDIASRLSEKSNVVVIDERGELDVENFLCDCDILKWTSKQFAFELAVRSLSPNYIICDELSTGDVPSIARAVSSGVNVVSTVHGWKTSDVEYLLQNVSCKFSVVIVCEAVGRYKVLSNI